MIVDLKVGSASNNKGRKHKGRGTRRGEQRGQTVLPYNYITTWKSETNDYKKNIINGTEQGEAAEVEDEEKREGM